MKNLNKFTKAELISKFKRLENKNSNQTLFSRFIEYILWFKGLIFKITLIAMLIKTLKKYSLFGKIFRFINWIILSIFGISIIDNFGLDMFKNFFFEIRTVLSGIVTYFSNTHFYSFLASLFKTKEEVTTRKISIREDPMSWESTGNEPEIKQSKGNLKISEWLKSEEEVVEESNNTKYYIIAGIIIGCLAAYYWGDITPILRNLYDKIKPKKDGDGNPGNISDVSRGHIQPPLDKQQRLLDIYDNELKSDVSQIELIDKTKNIASGSNVKLDSSSSSDSSMGHYFSKQDNPIEPQLTGLRPITGQDFTGESNSVVQEINTFLKYHDNASFPKEVAVGAGFYKVIRERLSKLADFRRSSYEQLIENDEVNTKIERFLDLEKEFYTQPSSPQNDIINLDNQGNTDNQNIIENQSDTYEEVAVANIESRMAWSDRATPSIHSQALSPVSNHENLDTNITNLIHDEGDLDDSDLLKKVEDTFVEDIGLKYDTQPQSSEVNIQSTSQILPDINIDTSSSSDNSINQYFTKPEDVKEVKPVYTFGDMLNEIKSRRDDSYVVGSPQVGQLGLNPGLSPLNTKPSISNLLDDTQALFDDEDEILPSISSIDKGKGKEVNDNLLSAISNTWNDVETNIHYGDNPNDIIVNLEYGDLWTRISKYRFILNNGQIIDYDYFANGDIFNRTFDLSSKIEVNDIDNIDIKEITILDLNHNWNSVWKNTKFFD